MKLTLWRLAAALGAVVWFTQPALAAELRVLDDDGLLRAYKRVSEAVIVSIEIIDQAPPRSVDSNALLLENLDGTTLPLESTPLGTAGDRFAFEGVTPGSWRLRTPDKLVRISKVRIESAGVAEKDEF